MSTIDSTTFISSLTFNNFIKRIFKQKFKQNINWGLIITSILSIILCYYFNEAIGYWYIFGSIASCTLLIPFIITLYLENYTLKQPGLSMIIPLITTIYFIINQIIDYNSIYPKLLLILATDPPLIFIPFKSISVDFSTFPFSAK